MEIHLTGKRVLVTGSSSGIGAAIAEHLGAAGARVAVNYRSSEEGAEDTVKKIVDAGGEAFKVQADISDATAVEKMFAEIDSRWGGIDVLINNAGIDGERLKSWEIGAKDWKNVIDINLLGTFYCSQQALKRMVPAESGVILNISSVHEEIAWSGHSAYTASKAGISMMMKTMAQEASPHGVRVLAVAPGAIRTPINKDVWSDPENLKDLKSKIPMNRIGEPEEVARLVVVLVSDVGSYVTGETIFVDGGMTDYPSFAQGG